MKLIVPVLFLFMEIATAMVLNWQLFGENYQFENKGTVSEVRVHNPLIVINAFHSDRITNPYADKEETAGVHLYSSKYLVKALSFLLSLLISYVGIFIALLWIKRFFRHNSLNIKWWLWPTACLGAHAILFMMANSNFSNILLKHF